MSLVQMAMEKEAHTVVAELVEHAARVMDSKHDPRLDRYLRVTGQFNRGGHQMVMCGDHIDYSSLPVITQIVVLHQVELRVVPIPEEPVVTFVKV
jgi:hypothetical protein